MVEKLVTAQFYNFFAFEIICKTCVLKYFLKTLDIFSNANGLVDR